MKQSPLVTRVLVAPGNGGIPASDRRAVQSSDMQGLVRLAKDENADLAVVGPERPLVAGLVNLLELAGIPASGPTLAAAKLEGSKTFMKQMCELTETPTAV